MNTILLPRRVYYLAIAGLAFLFAITLPYRIEHFDDAWCTEQTYWLLKEGHARSEMFRGIDFWHERLYVFHKAFVYAQVPVLWLFNFNVIGAKATSLIFSLVGLGLLLRYFRGQGEAQALALALYLGCGTLILFGFDNRPDTMAMAFGFASYLVLSRSQLLAGQLVWAGVLAGVAVLAHLNGLIYPAAGALWLLWQYGWRQGWWRALMFGLAAGLTASLYVADALLDGRLDRLVYQFVHYHSAASNHSWASKWQVMTHYHQTFFHSEGESFLSALLLLVLGVLAWRPATRPGLSPALRYLLLLLGLFWLLTKSNTAYYYLLFVPFMVVVVAEYVLAAAPQLVAWQRTAVLGLLLLYPVGAGLRAYNLVRENHSYPDTATENARLARYMPRHGSVAVVPLDFFFNEMEHYRLRSLTMYAMRNTEQYHDTLSVAGFFALAAQDSAEYVVTDHRRKNHVFEVPPTAPARIGEYERVFQNAWHSVYRRTK
jgi:hypothetical protein